MRRWFSICNIHSWNTRLGTPNDTRSWEHKSDPGGWGYTLGSCVGSDTLLFPVRVFCCALWVSPVRTGPCHTWVINATWVWLRPWRGPCCHLTHLEKRLQAIGSAGHRRELLGTVPGALEFTPPRSSSLSSHRGIWRCVFTEGRGEDSQTSFFPGLS